MANADAPVALERPIDAALSLSLSGQPEAALRLAAPILEAELLSPLNLLVTARLLGELGRVEAARAGLKAAAERAIFAGNLALSVAACIELTRVGGDAAELLDQLARAFAKGSSRIVERRGAPPELAPSVRAIEPLAESVEGDALCDRAEEILSLARERVEQANSGAQPEVPPQVLFSSLNAKSLRATVEAFDVRFVPGGGILVEEGTVGEEAFILARGELEVTKRAQAGHSQIVLARLGNGALFGEMALLSRAPRTATVTACRPSIVLVASKEALDDVAARVPEVGKVFAEFCRRRMLDNLARTNFILRGASASERPALLERFVLRQFEAGDKIVSQGAESDGMHLIALGEVAIVHADEEDKTIVTRLGPGEVVGEVALIFRRPAIADVVAHHPTVTLFLPRERFLDLIKAHPKVFVQLYELAVQRDEETASMASAPATESDDFVLV